MGAFMSIEKIYTAEFLELIKKNTARLIDVREPDEFAQGHIPGAMNYPLSQLQYLAFPENIDLIFYCRSGYRSQIVAEHYIQKSAGALSHRCFDYKDGYLGYLQAINPTPSAL